MHKLDRSTIPAPACLEVARKEGRTYAQLKTQEKNEIRARLLELQHYRCAYCERRTGDDPKHGGHIEHFRQQSSNHLNGAPELSTSWDNLFWSCLDLQTCGKHKDLCNKHSGHLERYDADHLIDPAHDDPEDYLLFVSDGTVQPRPGLDAAAQKKAETTIRVFQLQDSAYLEKSREDAVQPFVTATKMMMGFGVEPLAKYVATVLSETRSKPFSTAIKHFLKSVI